MWRDNSKKSPKRISNSCFQRFKKLILRSWSFLFFPSQQFFSQSWWANKKKSKIFHLLFFINKNKIKKKNSRKISKVTQTKISKKKSLWIKTSLGRRGPRMLMPVHDWNLLNKIQKRIYKKKVSWTGLCTA